MHDFPIHLDIESTNLCQLECSMCPRPKMKRPTGLMSFELLKKIVDESRGKVKTCYLHQIGEPLLHPEIVRFINYAADAGINTSISTNCLALNEKKALELLGSKLNELSLCIDSLNPDVYLKMRKGSDFHKMMWNVERFLELARDYVYDDGQDLKITIQLIKTKYNIDEVDGWTKYFNDKAKGLNYEILAKEFSTFADNVENIGTKPDEIRHRCPKAVTTMTINWDGTAVLCCRDFDNLTTIGNVNNQTLSEIWHGENYNNIRQMFKDKNYPDFCKKC